MPPWFAGDFQPFCLALWPLSLSPQVSFAVQVLQSQSSSYALISVFAIIFPFVQSLHPSAHLRSQHHGSVHAQPLSH